MCTKSTVYAADCRPRFHGTFHNDKLGGKKQKIMAVGYNPGAGIINFEDGRPVADIPGTCGCVNCEGCAHKGVCYAIDAFVQYMNKTIADCENTLQIRQDPDAHFHDMLAAIDANNINVLRGTESGELENLLAFMGYVNIADQRPAVEVYLYTKNYAVLREFFSIRELPENMTVLISIWGSVGVAEYNEFKHHRGIKAFVVNNDDIKPDAHCPAYQKDPKTGRVYRVKSDAVKCGNCKLCTRSRAALVIACYEH